MDKHLRWWFSMSPVERQRASMLFWCGVVYLVHYLVFCIVQPFFIEDAGISFAYARNVVEGEGFVAYPGGERVEGFSNPLWTFLIAVWYALGVSVWVSSKILGAVFGVLTLPLIFGISKRLDLNDRWAAGVALSLSLSPNFVIWNASGLENSLYCFLLALGMWRLLKETEHHRLHPLSGFVFCLVAMTRPEGVMYAAVAGFAKTLFAIKDRRYGSIFLWASAFLLPFGLYQAWRYWYFAWPYPNTYYAKLGTGNRFKPFGWTIRGWKYIKGYLEAHNVVDAKVAAQEIKIHLGYVLPLFLLAMCGVKKRWTLLVSGACLFWLSVVIFWSGKWQDAPEFWREIQLSWAKVRVYSILLVAILLGLVSMLQKGWRARSLLWAMGCSSLFFVIYSGGDWMKAHRWFNIVVLFLLPLLILGAQRLSTLLPSEWSVPMHKRFTRPLVRSVVVLSLFVCYAVSEVKVSAQFVANPETSVNDIHRRVRYMTWVQNRLDIDHVTLLDVDMGAHMYYSGWNLVDTAGLVDVSIARHSDYNRKFIKEYIFEERLPEFAHCHGGWARTSRIPKNKEWKKRYIEIPGYPIGRRKLHIGNHIRKDLFVLQQQDRSWRKEQTFTEGIRLFDWRLPAAAVAAGGALSVETHWQSLETRESDVQVLIGVVNAGQIVSIAAFQPGYRWYDMKDWTKNEVVSGKFPVPIAKDMATGKYAVWLAVLDTSTGRNLTPETDAVLVDGIQWFDTQLAFSVVSAKEALAQAEKGRQGALLLAQKDQCEASWTSWKDSTKHVYRNKRWKKRHDREHRNAVATCYFERAQSTQNEVDQIELLLSSRKWGHRIDGLVEYIDPIAVELDQRGQDLFALEDWDGAYEAFATSVALDPSRSMTRRRAEEARDKRLNIRPPYEKKKTKSFKKQILK